MEINELCGKAGDKIIGFFEDREIYIGMYNQALGWCAMVCKVYA